MLIIKYEKFISKKLLQVLSRIIGILLAALSVQFINRWIKEAIKTFNKLSFYSVDFYKIVHYIIFLMKGGGLCLKF